MTARTGILFATAGLSAALAIVVVTACQSAPDSSRARAQAPVAVAAGAPAEDAAMGVWQPPEGIDRESDFRMKMGLPPRGYWRTIGNEVPNWTPDEPVQRSALLWTPIGPKPVVLDEWSGGGECTGRVVSIAPHPIDPNIVYIASASGGIWKTIDGGLNWAAMSDGLASLNHGIVALCLSQPDTIFAGTGEYTTDSVGSGIFRSDDGGGTWVRIGAAAGTGSVGPRFTGIAVNPLDPNTVHVTTSQGYYHTTDGGVTWTRPPTSGMGSLPTGACTGLAMDIFSTGGNTLFVVRSGDGIYKTVDGGLTMGKLGGGLPDRVASPFTRIVLAMSPTDGNTLYAAFIAPDQGLEGPDHNGFYKTNDGGNSWQRMENTPNFPAPMGAYSCAVAVDPTDPGTVFCGGVCPPDQDPAGVAGIIRSSNGGGAWSGELIGDVHRFIQGFAFGPDGTLWVASDGGVWKSIDQGTSWTNCNATLHVTQHYHASQSPQDPRTIISGTQGSGFVITQGTDVWGQLLAGDAGWSAYDTRASNRFYYASANLRVLRDDFTTVKEITGSWSNPVTHLPIENMEYIAPLVYDSNAGNTIYVGTYRIWKNDSASATMGPPPASFTDWEPKSSALFDISDELHTIALGGTARLYTGSAAGKLFVSPDHGDTWKRFSKNETIAASRVDIWPVDDVTDIMIDPASPGTTLYVSFFNTTGARLFKTTNPDTVAGWASITGNMPGGVRVLCLAADWDPGEAAPPVFYAGTGSGIYTSADGGATWVKDGAEFPNVLVNDLIVDPGARTLTAVTYGRGVWRASLDGCSDAPTFTSEPSSRFACDGDEVTFSVTATGTMLSYQWYKNGFPIGGATATTYTILGASTADNGLYQCLVSNECGYDVTAPADLTIGFMEVHSQPEAQSVCEGESVSFCFGVTSVPPATYQWYKNAVPIPGAVGPCYSIASVTSDDIGSYSCEATSLCAGPLVSQSAGLAVGVGPEITTHPQSQTAAVGGSVTFSVTAGGALLFSYIWRKDGIPIAGATLSTYTITPVALDDAADYSVTVSNSCGFETSDPATLTISGGCPIDFTMDGVIDFGDYLEFLNLFDALDPRADLNMDGVIDFADYLEFLNHFDAGC